MSWQMRWGSVMLFIGEATLFSSVPGSCAGDSLRREIRVLKLKNPRTSVGAGAKLAELRSQVSRPPHTG